MKLVKESLNEDERNDISSREIIEKAIDEIHSLGYRSPFDNGVIINNNVVVEVYAFDGYLHLSSIMSIEKHRGDATEVMHKICEIADKYKVTIHLVPEPFGLGERLNKTQLINWYKKFGFKKEKYDVMKRHPAK